MIELTFLMVLQATQCDNICNNIDLSFGQLAQINNFDFDVKVLKKLI